MHEPVKNMTLYCEEAETKYINFEFTSIYTGVRSV